jgi:predicted dehydrogenase
MSSRAVRCGIVGFGFMGPQHAEAMQRLGFVDVAAVCSTTPELAREKASRLGISKIYANYEDLLDDRDIEVIDIVTPTRLHHPIAMAALSRGKHVIVDKPLALNLEQAREMWDAARAAGVVHAVTFNYRYHPLVQQARVMVERGEVGAIHLLHGHYLQEWLLYDTDFSWRLDPGESGPAAMVGDAACHWFDLVEHVTGLRILSILAELKTVIPTRRKPLVSREAFAVHGAEETEPYTVRVPDLGATLLRLSNGGIASFYTSPLCAGHKNDLRFEIHGAKLSLSWEQEAPNQLWIGQRGQPDQLLSRDPGLLAPEVRQYTSLPGGHSEGWPDALKNVLRNVFQFIADDRDPGAADGILFPTFADGYRAAAISDALVRSDAAGGIWTNVQD